VTGRSEEESTSVIVTKVRPPRRRRDLISRRRLVDYISDNIDRKLLLVSAPAGYGKTSLLVDFVHQSDLPVCWYRIDAADGDPAVFMEHLLASIRQTYPGTCERTSAVVRSEETFDVETVVGSLVNEIDQQIHDFFLLVLDDYQNVDDSITVNRAVDTLLLHLPVNVQLVIVSRTLPTKLTLTRLAGQGQVAGVGQEQLRFTPREIHDLVQRLHGKQLSEMECERLARESEGWITALVLGSERLLGGIRIGLARPAADKVRLFDFLAKEVYDAQPDDVRAFLAQSAVLDELSPDLCDRVLDRNDSADMLTWIEEHNLFVTRVEGVGAWYRYHQLFRDFLLERLADLMSPDAIALLHKRAARWYDEAGQPIVAVHHLLASGDATRAAARIDAEIANMHAQGRWQTIVRWAEALPDSELRSRPKLLVHVGMAHWYVGNPASALAAFETALRAYRSAGDSEGEATVLVSRSPVWRITGQLDSAIADSRRALSLTDDPSGLTAGLAHRSLGGSLAQRGEMISAADELQRALSSFEAHGAIALAAHAHTDLSAIYQYTGDIDRSINHSRAARDLWEQLGNFGALAVALNNTGTAYHQQGRFDEARATLEEAVRMARLSGVLRAEAGSLISLADVLCDMDDFAAALRQYDSGIELARSAGDSTLLCYGLAARGEACRLAGDLLEARNSVAAARAEVVEHRTAFETALIDYVRGTLAVVSSEYGRAAEHLEDAARGFKQIGARREELRALLYRSAAARKAEDDADADIWLARAESGIEAFGHRASLEPYLARVRRLSELDAEIPQEDHDRRAEPVMGTDARGVDGLPGLEVRALGAPIILKDGVVIDHKAFQTLIARDLLLLLVDRPGGVPRDELMAAFWPESTEVRARSSLHTTLYRVRRALGDKGLIRNDFERYFVQPSRDIHYDVRTFEECIVRAGEAQSDQDRVAAYEDALGLVRGEYAAGVLWDWAVERREVIEALITEAHMGLAEALARLRLWQAAIEAYRNVLSRDAFRDEAHRGLMRAYVAAGDRARALQQFENYRKLVGLVGQHEPTDDALTLYESIRDEDVSNA
jgi:ATP/maltotriose-dependent transcriptional regulator MalT/DNA-binding SARP family transcriptional activator